MSYVANKDVVINFVKNSKSNVPYGAGIYLSFFNTPFELTYRGLANDHFKTPMFGFTLKEMIGCCGILVSTGTFVKEIYKGQGIAQELMQLKIAIAKEFGYSLMMATVDIGNNPAEVHILEKFGWKKVDEVINKRTNHTLGIFTLNIK